MTRKDDRRQRGAYYTSNEDIHKVIDPLFLDDLVERLSSFLSETNVAARAARLKEFVADIGKIAILDPACGSGNFLVESFLSLRRLEDEAIGHLLDSDAKCLDDYSPSVTAGKFYGIEIDEDTAETARDSMESARKSADEMTRKTLEEHGVSLPTNTGDNRYPRSNVIAGNALRTDWSTLVPPTEWTYVVGNPPFVGNLRLDDGQKADRDSVFGPRHGMLDYAACWYRRGAEYIRGNDAKCAFVSTNSVCQGPQVEPLWKPIADMGVTINFARRSFPWGGDGGNEAHVQCVVVGMSSGGHGRRPFIIGRDGKKTETDHVNAYLLPEPDSFVKGRRTPICPGIKPLLLGGQPSDDGGLILSEEERHELVEEYPETDRWIRPYVSGNDILKGKKRYCLWLLNATEDDLKSLRRVRPVRERLDRVRRFREKSARRSTIRGIATPHLFADVRYPKSYPCLVIPKDTSSNRALLPLVFVDDGTIPCNGTFFIDGGDLYDFGILSSTFHNAWMEMVSGRLKDDYRYNASLAYNDFVWPNPNPREKSRIISCSERILETRERHEGRNLVWLYSKGTMPDDLKKAHEDLDSEVEEAYGVDFGGDRTKIVSHLLGLYSEVADD